MSFDYLITCMGLLILFVTAAAMIVAAGTLALIHHMERPKRITYGVALARRMPTDPRDLNLDAEERMIRYDDGVQTPMWIIKGGLAAGPTIIVSHGLADSRYGSLLRLHALTPVAGRVILYDLRGHGDSTAKRSTLTAKEPDDLLHLMNEVDDGSPFILMGHSMGAGISMVAAAKEIERNDGHPPRVRAVIAEGGYRWPMETIAGYLRMRGWPTQPFVWLAGMHFSFWLGITNASFDRVAVARRLTCPLLVLNGEEDRISPRHSAQQVAQAAPKGALVLIPGGTHGNLPVDCATQYAQAIRTFLENLS